MAVSLERARAAKVLAKPLLADLPHLVGLGLTKVGDDYALKVNLGSALPPGVTVPEHIGGVAVVVEFVGVITKRG